MVVTSDDDGSWLDPRAAIGGIAVLVVIVIFGFDSHAGMVAGAVLAVPGAIWLYLAVRYGSLRGGPPSERKVLAERVRQQASNRRLAARRSADRGGQARPDDLP